MRQSLKDCKCLKETATVRSSDEPAKLLFSSAPAKHRLRVCTNSPAEIPDSSITTGSRALRDLIGFPREKLRRCSTIQCQPSGERAAGAATLQHPVPLAWGSLAAHLSLTLPTSFRKPPVCFGRLDSYRSSGYFHSGTKNGRLGFVLGCHPSSSATNLENPLFDFFFPCLALWRCPDKYVCTYFAQHFCYQDTHVWSS